MPDTNEATIWVISDGNPGHYNQSLAIAGALCKNSQRNIEIIPLKRRLRGLLRPWYDLTMNRIERPFPEILWRHFLPASGLPTGQPVLIVSSGGSTAYLNISLARKFSCDNIFIGNPARLSKKNFSAVVVTEQEDGCRNCVVTDFLPTPVTPDGCRQSAERFITAQGLRKKGLWTLLVGGATGSHRYKPDEWERLGQAMNALAARHDIQWLISTSRRTGAKVEAILRHALKPETVADATWWGEAPRKVVHSYLGAGEIIFCTQDSLTMLTEAMASGKPVYALYPADTHIDPVKDSFYYNYLARNEQAGRIKRIPVALTDDIDPGTDIKEYFHIMRRAIADEIAKQLDVILNKTETSTRQAGGHKH